MGRRVGVALAGALVVCSVTAGCDTGPKCLHYETQVVPYTTIVNGKVSSGVHVVTICTQYEERDKK